MGALSVRDATFVDNLGTVVTEPEHNERFFRFAVHRLSKFDVMLADGDAADSDNAGTSE